MGRRRENFLDRLLAAFDRLRRKRGRLALALAGVMAAASAAVLPGMLTGEDARVLIPDRPAWLAEDFALLSRAPLARRVFILLQAGPEALAGQLDRAADALDARLGPPLFREPGPRASGPELVRGLLGLAPRLLTPEESRAFVDGLTPDAVRQSVQGVRQDLASPRGLALKPVLRLDPLGLRTALLARLPGLGPEGAAPDARGRLRSPDGRSLILTAATGIPFTDAAGAERLLAGFREAVQEALPPAVSATLVSGHRHSLANAQTIKADLARVLPLSAAGLILIVLVFLRSLGSVWVLLTPLGVLCLAGAATGAIFGGLHGIVFGFGGVLMGLAVDYPVHVQHVLRLGGDRSAALGQVARPLLYGALTSLAAFSALLFSEVPAIRQMAVFSMVGLAAALLFSLLALPQLLPSGPADRPPAGPPPQQPRARGLVLAGWAAALGVLGWMSLGLRVNGDIAALGVADPLVRADEARLREALGGLRDRAMVFASGPDLERAAQANAQVLALLRQSVPAGEAFSLAPLLPPREEQERNARAWHETWSGERGQAVAREVLAAGRELGFTDQAFAPFLELLAHWGGEQPAPGIDLEALLRMGLGDVVDLLVQEQPGEVTLLTLTPETPLLAGGLGRSLEELPGVRVVSHAGFARDLGVALRRDYLLFVGLSLASVCGLVLALFRRPGTVAAAMAPACTGLAAVSAGAGQSPGGLDLFNIAAAPLIVGLAADYGIFMACRGLGECESGGRPVLVCGLTTLAGFGTLAAAQHPALRSLGLSILLGIGAALPTALLVTPRLLGGPGGERTGSRRSGEAGHAQ